VNLNTAGKEELMTLRGVGDAKADDIIRYRESHGGFQKIEDIMKISGIKEAAFQKIKDDITV
jgi:competence protein ComEA